MGNFDISDDIFGPLDFGLDFGPAEPAPEEEIPEKRIKVHRAGKRQLTRKAASEHALEEALDWHFRDGDCYHCFSFGDVDSMSFF